MAVLRCSVCGGELEVNSDMTVGVCKYCEATILIPKELERKGNLYNRAIFLRQANDFDKAEEAYEDILKTDNNDAEAHWGLVLSKYGIEYVTDPKTREKIPTCHRTQKISILSDPDYHAAIECADIEAQKFLEKEAERINQIQSRILEVSEKEPPYDVFICYKESDEIGNRTEDSILSQELYYELQKKGYRVFFSRKTLERKLGSEYEPIIFAALNSAKVMIVLGTKAEHFNSVWVKNEWRRFLKLSSVSEKTIIPAYRGISPYELPAELASLQSLDMSKIGFMQELLDGIERITREKMSPVVTNEELAGSVKGIVSLERLLKNSQTYLELHNYEEAEKLYQTITKEYPEEYRGWWGLMVCKTKNFTEVIQEQSTLNVWFGYVKQLASSTELIDVEETYINYVREVSKLDAKDDIEQIQKMIKQYTEQCFVSSLSIQKTSKEKKEYIEKFEHEEALHKKQMVSSEDKQIENESYIESSKTGLIISGVAIFFGVIVLLSGAVIGGLVIAGIGVISFYYIYDENSFNKYRIENVKEEITTQEVILNKKYESYKKVLENFDNKINGLNKSISKYKAKIAACEKYLDLGEEEISSYWFFMESKAFGAQYPCSNKVKVYRSVAYSGEIEEKIKETVSISCPACNAKFVAVREELISKGYFICPTCDNKIEVNAKNK